MNVTASSPYLINENPMNVLPSLAETFGINQAIILQQFQYWISRSKNIKDGRRWIYNSFEDWNKQFSWLNIRTIKRIVKSLVNQGIIITGNYNKLSFDRTNWYSIDYDKLTQIVESTHSDKMSPREGQNVTLSKGQNVTNNNHRLPETTTKPSSHKSKIYDDDSPYLILAKFLNKKIHENNPKAKQPNLQKWADVMRKIVEIDKRDKHDVSLVIDWCQKDDFWSTNILSASKLRTQFDQLYLKMQKEATKSNPSEQPLTGEAKRAADEAKAIADSLAQKKENSAKERNGTDER